jgi:hypothetical protein
MAKPFDAVQPPGHGGQFVRNEVLPQSVQRLREPTGDAPAASHLDQAMGWIANAGDDCLDELLCNKIRQKITPNRR